MLFYVYDPTGTTQRTGTVGAGALTVASHTNTAVTATTNLPSDFVIGDIIVPTGGNQTGFKGLPYLVNNTGNYFNLSRSSVPQLQSTVVNASSAALSTTLMMTLYNSVLYKSGRPDDNDINWMTFATSPTQLQAYYNLTTTNTQWMHTEAGRPGIDVGGKNVQFTWFGARLRRFFWIAATSLYLLDLTEGNLKCAMLKRPGELTALPLGDWYQAFNGDTSVPKAARDKWWDIAADNYLRMPFKQGVIQSLDIAGLPVPKTTI
jgi:hypothetical protein